MDSIARLGAEAPHHVIFADIEPGGQIVDGDRLRRVLGEILHDGRDLFIGRKALHGLRLCVHRAAQENEQLRQKGLCQQFLSEARLCGGALQCEERAAQRLPLFLRAQDKAEAGRGEREAAVAQLTMRTFHTGGAKDQSDITEGLPRVEELFEARKPKSLALISEISGTVSEREIKKVRNIIVTDPETLEEKAYPIHYGMRVKVEPGDHINKGDTITEGALNPHDILAVLGVEAVHDYLIREVQRTYRMQGVDVNDKHIEVIVRQMMKKVKITDPGDTTFLPGAVVDKLEFKAENARVAAKAQETGEELAEAQCMPVLMGITKASLATESFLSAASFQETTRVLTDAAIKGKSDPLLGLKENVIIGKLLPSGTGMKCYSDVQVLPTTGIFSDLAEKLEEAENQEEAE